MDINLEAKCLKELGEGSRDAFDTLYIHYSPRVRCFLAGFMKDNDEATDMVQDLFFKVWINRKVISRVDSFKAYLFRMARNMVYDYYEHSLIKETYSRKQQEKSSYSDIIEEELYAKELAILIDMAIENMPSQQRNIFLLSRKEGLSNEEIAQKLDISKRTVENHITRALSELRKISYSILFFVV